MATDWEKKKRVPSKVNIKMQDERLIIEWLTYACNWDSCIFCGYKAEHSVPDDVSLSSQEVFSQLEFAINSYFTAKGKAPEIVEIYPSGSFFDIDENSVYGPDVIDYFAGMGAKRFKSSTRVQYIPWEQLKQDPPKIPTIMYIGLESALNSRLKQMKKGITFEGFERAVKKSEQIPNLYIGAHLIAKPTPIENIAPELADQYSHITVEDEIAAQEFAYSIRQTLKILGYDDPERLKEIESSPFPDRVTLRQTIPAKGSLLNALWSEGKYSSIHPKHYWAAIKEVRDDYGNMPFHHIGGAQPWFAKKR